MSKISKHSIKQVSFKWAQAMTSLIPCPVPKRIRYRVVEQNYLSSEIGTVKVISALVLISITAFWVFSWGEVDTVFAHKNEKGYTLWLQEQIISETALAVPQKKAEKKVVNSSVSKTYASQRGEGIFVNSGQELLEILKEANLWDLLETNHNTVPPVLFNSLPADFADLGHVGITTKKKAFIHSILPAVVIALDEVREERQKLLAILAELGKEQENVVFDANQQAWQEDLSPAKRQYVLVLAKKYRTDDSRELLNRINVLPVSLIIAQGAIESSWGSSRFAREANNLFGIWTWGKKGLVPAQRDEGKVHKIAIYDSILDSVRAYVLTINRVGAYDDLRAIRANTLDPLQISEGLLNYSERRALYIDDVKRIIQTNNLDNYDKYTVVAG